MPQITKTTRTPSAKNVEKAQAAVSKLTSLTASGFYKLPHWTNLWIESQEHGVQLAEMFTDLGVLGIGGSSLGPKVIDQALESSRRLHVLENVDPLSFERKLKNLNLAKTHWLVISKSGKTLETLSQLSLLVPRYRSQGASISAHFTVISDPVSNPLTEWAQSNGVRILNIPASVGGRFSVLSPVGLVPAAFLGHSCEAMRQGALGVQSETDAVVQAVAQTLESFEKSEWITVFWAYTDLLQYFGGWIQQLWAESLAKAQSRSGGTVARVSTPLPLIGANDQHSILQQVMEGAKDKFVWFLQLESAENSGPQLRDIIGLPSYLEQQKFGRILGAERRATQEALLAQGVQSLTLKIPDLSPRSLGAIFMFFEMVVAATAEALEINAFDQPGVELGKRLAFEILQREQGLDLR